MTRSDEVRRNASFRGNLLELASFLTKLQFDLVPEGLATVLPSRDAETADPSAVNNAENDFVVVSMEDLQKVLAYRRLLSKEEKLLNQMVEAKDAGQVDSRFDRLGQLMSEQVKVELEETQEFLKEFTTRTHRIHFLWTRLEVWWAKIASQKLLLNSVQEFAVDQHYRTVCCYSALMNLPASKYFRDVLPEPVEDETDSTHASMSAFHNNELSCCSLPLPPNKHTWREFSRIARMVGLLENEPMEEERQVHPRQLAMKSPCIYYEVQPEKYRHHRQSHAGTFDFEPHDLVALWVRAQRNTQALRQMWMLFEVKPLLDDTITLSPTRLRLVGDDSRGTGKRLVENCDHQIDAPPKPREFAAELMGNPKYASKRITELSNRVDRLVEWAVTNQVLFTHKHVQRYLMASPSIRQKRKFDHIHNTQEKDQLKRAKRDFSSKSDVLKLLEACQSFVLQWFARRNRFVASFLFANSTDNHHVDLSSTKADHEAIVESFAPVYNNFKANFKKKFEDAGGREGANFYADDNTLAKVDVRLRVCEQRYNGGKIALKDQLLAMLEALKASANWNAHQNSMIDQATEDLKMLFRHFFERKRDVYDIAMELVSIFEADSPKDISVLLENVPKPWPTGCSASSCRENEGKLLTCCNCERVLHESCAPGGFKKVTLAEITASSDSLRLLLQLARPSIDVPAPDFSNDTSLEYTEVDIDIERRRNEDGTVPPLGLGLRSLEECVKLFDELNRDSATVLDLMKTMETEKRTRKPGHPVKGVKVGSFLVIEAKSGCGKSAGVRSCDIISAVEHFEFADAADAAEYGNNGLVELKSLSNRQATQYLQIKSTKLRLKVLRPSRNIVHQSHVWMNSLKNANGNLLNALREGPMDLFCCADCLNQAPGNEASNNPPSSHDIVEEARRCKAVIRRVGLESCALPFVDEDIFTIQDAIRDGSGSDGMFFCLRRLDAMMTFIIGKHTASFPEDAPIVTHPMALPPWAQGDRSMRKFQWAPDCSEDKPVDLLCRALLAWQEVGVDETKKKAKRQVIRNFLTFIAAWGALPSSCGEGLVRTKGPPEVFLRMQEPWFGRSCVFCCSRPGDDGSIACTNALCAQLSRTDYVNMDDLSHEDASKVLGDIREYNEFSSLVGTTFLVLPDDPLVVALAESSVLKVDHCGRPVEFVIASYLPPSFVPIATKSKPKDSHFDRYEGDEGIFHLLPLATVTQLNYLLDRCATRKKGSAPPEHGDLSWICLDVLNEGGVARYSHRELKMKLAESDAIRRSIDENIALLNGANEQEAAVAYTPRQTHDFGRSDTPESGLDVDVVASHRELVDIMVSRGLIPESVCRRLSSRESDESRQSTGGSESSGFDGQGGRFVTTPTPITVDILPTGRTDCDLLYSDLHFSSSMSPAWTESLLPKSLYRPPASSRFGSTVETILLQRSEQSASEENYDGVGFGFEVVRWAGDTKTWIGRVHKHSPAYAGGLRAGDELLSAGGLVLSELQSPLGLAELAIALLGAPLQVQLGPQSADPIRLVLSAVKGSNLPLESVVLTIRRPKQGEKREFELVACDARDVQRAIMGSDSFDLYNSSTRGLPNESQRTNLAEGNELRSGSPTQSDEQEADSFDLYNSSTRGLPNESQRANLAEGNELRSGSPTQSDEQEASLRAMGETDDISWAPSEVNISDAFELSNDYNPLWVGPANQHQADSLPAPPHAQNAAFLPGSSVDNPIALEASPVDDESSEGRLREDPNLVASRSDTSSALRGPLEPRMASEISQRSIPLASLPIVPQHQIAVPQPRSRPRIPIHDLFSRLPSCNEHRVPASFGHLYIAAEGGTILTLMECSMFLECFLDAKPKLGMRLLCPRYSLAVIAEQASAIATWTDEQIVQIPRISKAVYSYILNKDYMREINTTKPEVGRVIFTETGHQYKKPVDILPIDRLIERFLQKERAEQEAQRRQFEARFEGGELDYEPEAFFPPASVHPNQQPMVQHHHNSEFAAGANPFTPPQFRPADPDRGTGGVFASRIRGGGPLAPSDAPNQHPFSGTSDDETKQISDGAETALSDAPFVGTCIDQLPLDAWEGLAVYAYIRPDVEDEEEEVFLVGWVKNAESTDGLVDVEGHYISSIGYTADPTIVSLYPEDVFVVDENNADSECAVVINTLRREGKCPKPQFVKKKKPVSHGNEVAATFTRQLGDGLKVLGSFPDGRQVVWLSSDPSALYYTADLREEAISAASQDYASVLEMQTEKPSLSFPILFETVGSVCCPWGCSLYDPDKPERLAFVTRSVDDFRAHCDQCHFYGTRADAADLGQGHSFVRVVEGKDIQELASGLSGSIIAMLPSFLSCATKDSLDEASLAREFVTSPTGEKLRLAWADPLLREELSAEAQKYESTCLSSTVNLWLAIGHLFDVDISGLYRLSQVEFEAAMPDLSDEAKKSTNLPLGDCCQLIPAVGVKERRFLDCALCSLPWEKCIGKAVAVASMGAPSTSTTRGIGCMLRSDTSFEKSSAIDENEFPGTIGEAKALLLRVADLIPTSTGLQMRDAAGESDPLKGLRLWDEGNFDVWKAFVRDCSSPRMLAQALTTLLGSIDRNRMPAWWKHDGAGWSTAQMVMASASMETFFLHLYVLDIALSETIGKSFLSKGSTDSTLNKKRKFGQTEESAKEKMDRWLAAAMEEGFTRFAGEHESYCIFCDDGGESLLCCELCSNVQHPECCEPPIEDHEGFDWVCDTCINDICHKKGIDPARSK